MTIKQSSAFISSLYNFHVPIDGNALLYNANTGAVLCFSGSDGLTLAQALSSKGVEIPEQSLSKEVYNQLLAGDFLVSSEKNELAEIRERFHKARSDTPIVLTLTTTIDCNLSCYYCYEKHSKARLEVKDIDAIVAFAQERLLKSGKQNLHVDWYGGEPLMNLEFMEAASIALQELCERMKANYVASVISNGTCWPEDIGAFVKRHKIRQVQITFDGLRDNHNRRRRYRRDYIPDEGASSFDRAVELVDRLLDYTHVDIRINIDPTNQEDVVPLIRFMRSKGWFRREFPAVIQPAKLMSYTEHSSFMRELELTAEKYDALLELVRNEIELELPIQKSAVSEGFPYPKMSVCAALVNNSSVIGADGREYRCGLQVAEPNRAVGNLRSPSSMLNSELDSLWWQQFDPTNLPKCSRCSFLPICWGGCPKIHLEQDEHAIAEQCKYWRKHLPRLIVSGVNAQVPRDFTFSETDQFRLGTSKE